MTFDRPRVDIDSRFRWIESDTLGLKLARDPFNHIIGVRHTHM